MCINEKMWRVRCAVHTSFQLQQIAISCKRSDYNKKNAKCHFWAAQWRSRTTGRPVLWCRSFTNSEVLDFFWIFMSSSRNRSTPTVMCWKKKMTDTISDTARKESVQVALLQTHGEDGAILLMVRWSLNGVSSVHCVLMCWEKSTNSFCI